MAGNSIDTLCVFLGTASLGALFSSSSTDMGARGVLERLRQVRPRWVFVDDASVYNGKTEDMRKKMEEIVAGMEEVEGFKGIVSLPRFEKPKAVSGMKKVQGLRQFLGRVERVEERFERVGFGEGFLIVYSSGYGVDDESVICRGTRTDTSQDDGAAEVYCA